MASSIGRERVVVGFGGRVVGLVGETGGPQLREAVWRWTGRPATDAKLHKSIRGSIGEDAGRRGVL
jgi:hypothetical protein